MFCVFINVSNRAKNLIGKPHGRTVGRNPENLVTGLQKKIPIYELLTYGIYGMAPLESFRAIDQCKYLGFLLLYSIWKVCVEHSAFRVLPAQKYYVLKTAYNC
jgi:hypothetical protein